MRALILTAGGLNLQTLINAAGSVGVESAWVITNNAGDSIVQEPPRPDFVIAVFNPGPDATSALSSGRVGPGTSPFDNLDVALRAGRAAGRGFPVLLIVPPPLLRPADLLGAVAAPCPLDNFDVLRLHLWAFVSTLPGRVHLEAGEAVQQPTTFDATSVVDQLSLIDPTDKLAPRQVEQLVASLLSQVGAETVENPERGERVDFAVLPTRTSSDVLLVEVMAGQLTEEIGAGRAPASVVRSWSAYFAWVGALSRLRGQALAEPTERPGRHPHVCQRADRRPGNKHPPAAHWYGHS